MKRQENRIANREREEDTSNKEDKSCDYTYISAQYISARDIHSRVKSRSTLKSKMDQRWRRSQQSRRVWLPDTETEEKGDNSFFFFLFLCVLIPQELPSRQWFRKDYQVTFEGSLDLMSSLFTSLGFRDLCVSSSRVSQNRLKKPSKKQGKWKRSVKTRNLTVYTGRDARQLEGIKRQLSHPSVIFSLSSSNPTVSTLILLKHSLTRSSKMHSLTLLSILAVVAAATANKIPPCESLS